MYFGAKISLCGSHQRRHSCWHIRGTDFRRARALWQHFSLWGLLLCEAVDFAWYPSVLLALPDGPLKMLGGRLVILVGIAQEPVQSGFGDVNDTGRATCLFSTGLPKAVVLRGLSKRKLHQGSLPLGHELWKRYEPSSIAQPELSASVGEHW